MNNLRSSSKKLLFKKDTSMINQRDISDTKFIMKQFSKQLQPNKLLVNIKK